MKIIYIAPNPLKSSRRFTKSVTATLHYRSTLSNTCTNTYTPITIHMYICIDMYMSDRLYNAAEFLFFLI